MRLRGRTACAALLGGGVSFVVAALLTAGVAVAGQFVGERFAPVLSTSDTAALDFESISVEPADGSDVRFVVTFRDGFESPADGYRIAVNVGDPTGKRTRWTLSVLADEVTGTVESGDGAVWDPVGPTVAELDASAGRATIVAQPAGVLPDSAMWVDAEVPTPLGPFGAATTYYSYDSLAPGASPADPTGAWGWIRDPDGIRVDGAVRVPGAPPAVVLANRALVVTAPDGGPSLLLDQPVTATADLLRVIDAGSGTDAVAGYVLVNRVTGEVQLFEMVDGEPVEVPDGGVAVVPAAAGAEPVAEPPSTRSVSVDLPALTEALGLPDDTSALAVTVDRAFTLGDGSVVTASGVAATLASLEPTGTPGARPAPVADDVVVPVDEADEGIPLVAVLIAIGVAVIAVAAASLIVGGRRRRRRHSSLLAEGWLDDELSLRAQGPAAAEGPRRDSVVAAAEPMPPAATSSEVVLDLDASNADSASSAGSASDGGENGNGHHDARATQEHALAELEAQFADLIERVDRLGSSDEGAA